MNYPMTCDTCGRSGTEDDGCELFGECPDESCDGVVRGTRQFVTIQIEFESTTSDSNEFAEEVYEVLAGINFRDSFAESDTMCLSAIITEVNQ